MSGEPLWWNGEPGAVFGDREQEDLDDYEDGEDDCCEHGIPFYDECEECEDED